MREETNIVRATRLSKDISVRTMAKLLRVKRKEYKLYEDNLGEMNAYACHRICMILGISLNNL